MANLFTYQDYKEYIQNTVIDTPIHEQYLKARLLTQIDEWQYEDIEEETSSSGIIIPVDKIVGSYLTNDYESVSLYELLTTKKHYHRASSLHDFFNILANTSVQECKNWLKSPACALTDSSQMNGVGGELPTAKYYPDIDKYFINSGKNRAFSAMLIGADEMCFNTVITRRKKV